MPVKVLIADDTAVMRSAIRKVLGAESQIEVVGEAEDFDKTIELTLKLRPHIVLLDLHMPNPANTVPSEIKARLAPVAELLAISIYDDEEARDFADSFGANAVLCKANFAEYLIPAVLSLAPARCGLAASAGLI